MFTRIRKFKGATTKIGCVLLFSFIGQGALAEDSNGMKLTADGRFPLLEELCDFNGNFAKLTMMRRQNGDPLSEVMSDAKHNDAVFNYNNTARDMALAAYDSPRYSVLDNKKTAIADFTNEWLLACYKAQR